jgi:hypothetical protein
MPEKQKRTLEEIITWWIDGLVSRNIPMIANKDGKGDLTYWSLLAISRGATLIDSRQAAASP